jgi:hypothetical protein
MGLLLVVVLALVLLRPATHLALWVLHLLVAAVLLAWHVFLWVFWVGVAFWFAGRCLGVILRRLPRAETTLDSYRWRPQDTALPGWRSSLSRQPAERRV